ncbi:uncharacterized protein LOC134206481 [Armigeres subalbatus]|uniref:uncharacterized protein LOC134206481 n=1 Tax=Armigeres subalbatus TaxID=124917 RepID=UPI002ED194FC
MPETERNDCKVCRRSNNVDDMVFCAVCEEWFHYRCVGVTSAVVNESWMCAGCSALPSSTRIGELGAGDKSIAVTIVSSGATGSLPAMTPSSSTVPFSMNSAFPLAFTAASYNVSSTALPSLPPVIAGPSGFQPRVTNPVAVQATSPVQSLLSEQARASLQWIRDQRIMLEQHMEEMNKKEMERKKAMLVRITENAMQGVLSSEASNAFNEQSAAVGIGKVGDWLGEMVGEMNNLSITPASAMGQVAASAIPVLNDSSTRQLRALSTEVYLIRRCLQYFLAD